MQPKDRDGKTINLGDTILYDVFSDTDKERIANSLSFAGVDNNKIKSMLSPEQYILRQSIVTGKYFLSNENSTRELDKQYIWQM